MHYFQFNIKDYQSHTGHLDDLEDLAYRRLLDWCYLHERPLPSDPAEVARLIRMRSHTDCIAAVLQEFFVSTKDGWISERVDREIRRMKSKSESARVNAKTRWNKNLDATASDPQSEGNAIQYPIPNTHNPKPKVKNTRTSTVVECFDGVEPQVWEDWIAIRKAKKLPMTQTAMRLLEDEFRKAGLSNQEALEKCCLQGWGSFRASWVTREGGATLNKQEALEARNRAVAQSWAAKMQKLAGDSDEAV